jgi:hypothetical protein
VLNLLLRSTFLTLDFPKAFGPLSATAMPAWPLAA